MANSLMDDFIFTIIRLMSWPYQMWKHSIENSRIGASPADHETLRFWRKFAICGSLAVFLLVGGIVGLMILK